MNANQKIPSKTLYRKYKTLILKHQMTAGIRNKKKGGC